jgi:hypothetical protein
MDDTESISFTFLDRWLRLTPFAFSLVPFAFFRCSVDSREILKKTHGAENTEYYIRPEINLVLRILL